jgi:hypothetical protein
VAVIVNMVTLVIKDIIITFAIVAIVASHSKYCFKQSKITFNLKQKKRTDIPEYICLEIFL